MMQLLAKIKRGINRAFWTKEERRHALVGPAHLWKMKRDFQIKFLREVGLKEEDYFLEIGCGTLRGGIPLIEYLQTGHYYGLDVREKALKVGRAELKEAGLQDKKPNLLLSPNMRALTIDQKIDVMWAFSVLFHMSDEILDSTIEFVSKHLADDGIFYANVNIGEKETGSWEEFPVVHRSYERYTEMFGKYDLEFTDIGELKDLGHVSGSASQDAQRMLKIVKKS